MKMATKQVTLVHVDDDYIDMELCNTSPNNFFSYSLSSPPSNREFEFQMSENIKESSTSPADDLFYKGKLLPLHLPPRLQMVQKLVENTNFEYNIIKPDSSHLRMPSTNGNSTPFESNISPSESRRVSSDVSPNEHQLGWFSDMNNLIGCDLPKKSNWPKKLKQMKQFWLGQRLKASRAYLRALFNKSGCSSDKFCPSAVMGAEKKSSSSKCKECQNKYMKIARRNNPFESFYDSKHQQLVTCSVVKSIKREMLEVEDDFCDHRRSFSGVGQRHCSTKASSLSTSSSGSSSTSSSFSFSSAGYYDLQLFKRSISANYELESSIEGAIAHCKQSQQHHCGSKKGSDNDSRICSQFATI